MKLKDITEAVSKKEPIFTKDELAYLKSELAGEGFSGKAVVSTKPTIRNSKRKKGDYLWNGEKSSIVYKRIMDLDTGKIIKRSYTSSSAYGIEDASILAVEQWRNGEGMKLFKYEQLPSDVRAKFDMM